MFLPHSLGVLGPLASPLATLAVATIALLAGTLAQANIVYTATLGPEAPGATGSGSVQITYLTAANDLAIHAQWTGLSGPTTVAHIHCCTAAPFTGTIGVAVTPGTLPGFPVGTTSGTYDAIVDLDSAASFTAGFVTNFAGGDFGNAVPVLLAALEAGRAYFNIHTTTFPGGEIRGFLQVPEPGSLALAGLALAAAAAATRRRYRGR